MTIFADRHIGPDHDDEQKMLEIVGHPDLTSLIEAAVPQGIRAAEPLNLPAALSEQDALTALEDIAGRNRTMVQMIGLGYHDTITPPVLRRNMLESPAWYTAYTPYQPEISQGRLEALLTFQTMVEDLTDLPVAGASLLDEATAVVEAVLLMARANKAAPAGARVVLDSECLPQTLAVLHRRAEPLGLPIDVVDLSAPGAVAALDEGDVLGIVLQAPGASGTVRDLRPIISAARARGALVTVAADLLSLALLAPPGQLGADIAVGSSQRFGVPLFFGGPHAAYMSVRSGLERLLPGRLVGVSRDATGRPGYRLALQTREQHIRREKATSNICTAQALLANVAAMYAVHHGPAGLRQIAERVHAHAAGLAAGLRASGIEVVHSAFFDTVLARVPGRADAVVEAAAGDGINLRRVDPDHVAAACDEVTTAPIVARVLAAFGATPVAGPPSSALPAGLRRTGPYLSHPVFSAHRSETSMLRYVRSLSDRDLALDRTMIPLGSCTMKLNATAEMEPIRTPGFASLHPFAPADQTRGYAELTETLENWLAEITGYDSVSLQPNAGSQGELAGLLAIRDYHRSRGDIQRTVCVIPSSAHGTNAASAVLAGMSVVVVATAADGSIELDDLRARLDANGDRTAAIMLTYPSTHGVYESDVRTVCDLVHEAGGQVYIDGANLNALVGLARPGEFGGDVSHLNLHKTFCIPHGGGGPGVGPVAVRSHLAPFLPGDPLESKGAPVSAAAFGSAGILPITYAYIAMMGPDGLTRATTSAVLAANYLARRLHEHYPVLYTGPGGLVAHECILDLRAITRQTGVTAEDVAKRLIDYGFHAPTLSFPVAGTLMVEPTESESLAEIDRFVHAMITIRAEIDRVSDGTWTLEDSPLRNAPHTADVLLADRWTRPYSREQAAFPVPELRRTKYWPPVGRIDGAHGDRNLVCSCPPPEAFATPDATLQELS
ncbi:aminomethyl-transferring glycine dehydrogenase [Pseudonocardia sp. KRD-184]|uniref:Glycine dehydrogenase (decarboxylating) n=1 Tax=Pseudonocardia oceani TaxID=2792013 RepID=A0ABS6UDD7_9PSEU|nr:aminomethyl-transferring glycine dehydrogenase [Pseudonocardia oceani]MBW0089135.1 aminomethyl-transferring glycine dehydrogenase [Pseudonocardia oceani]MBW0095975.1 aminomethyl-transferring glycine dehydrogenase [Pseudonocardia oceani]MBW0108863.1 aminomethyl-transferring glycine dehydrogenase [Pseudonocardia oceani]MBW0120206.1 aminomethyl-transferring glycine dehydrogenase [Pseudonocardia oceani]MBW0130250.1 aminomethyl-transferring glycine dehydrogenase [Pseudonocardia oceani]